MDGETVPGHKVVHKLFILVFVTGFVAASFVPVQAAGDCLDYSDIDKWLKIGTKAGEEREQEYDALKSCIIEKPGLQSVLDKMAVKALGALDDVSGNSRQVLADLAKRSFMINAEIGYPSSQHNLANLYNYDPKSPHKVYFEYNEEKFAYWTRKAASNAEPRSLFNMAVRLASDEPVVGFPQDKELASVLFMLFDDFVEVYPDDLSHLKPYSDRFKSDLRRDLRKGDIVKSTLRIITRYDQFDYSTLAPD